MAEASVTFLLENVSQLLKYYVGLIGGAQSEFQQLKNELALLKAFLVDAANKPKEEARFKEIERQIREVVYDAEDTIDTCLTHLVAVNNKNFMRRGIQRIRVDLPHEVRTIRQDKVTPMFAKAKQDFVTIQLSHGSQTSKEQPRPKLHKPQAIRQDNIVGFEDEEETIVNYLMEDKKELDVISIIGMPGLGKTTMAWKIYQSKKIRYEFPVCIWVYVSQTFSMKDVLLKILRIFTSHDMSSLDEEDLIERARGHLEEEKFFLVLDDVWTVDAWKSIRVVLPQSNFMSKVLITSCQRKVGDYASRPRVPHNLRFLREDESWELLQLEVFGKSTPIPNEELEHVGYSIAVKCDGLPLAVVAIGGILLGELSTDRPMDVIIDKWNEVGENLSKYLARDETGQGITDIVSWSYHILPTELRDCFLYLGVFPENYEIPASTLTCLWIAEGFIQHKLGQTLEQTAEENLKDLISRNLVMVEKANLNGDVKTCRVHDVVRAFCISKASIKEQNLFQEINKSKGIFDPPMQQINNHRRLCIHSNIPEFLSQKPRGARVRSFLCFNKAPCDLEAKLTPVISDAFKLLRVLNSMSIKFRKFPIGVTKLIHLRYITVSCDDIDSLPEAISELWNLQTLVVETHSSYLKIEANIWKMIQLRHLKTKAAIILVKNRPGEAGENLQTLSRLSPDCCTGDMFSRARNLKKLGIRGNLATFFNTMSLEKLHLLEKFKLVNDVFYGSASANKLYGLPQPDRFPPALKKLTLSATFLEWKHMSTLAKINTLEVLKLKDNAFIGIVWNTTADVFTHLEFLVIADTDLVYWDASTDSFPRLRCLVLNNCQNLNRIPLCLAKNLEKLEIENLCKSAVESAREIEAAKEDEREQQKDKTGVRFKLSIGPGCK